MKHDFFLEIIFVAFLLILYPRGVTTKTKLTNKLTIKPVVIKCGTLKMMKSFELYCGFVNINEMFSVNHSHYVVPSP